jgi:hypothetical protein
MSAGFMEEHMRRIHLLFVATAFFVLPTTGFADTPPEVSETAAVDTVVPEVSETAAVDTVVPEVTGAAPPDLAVPEDAPVVAPSEATDELVWDQFDDPDFDPEVATEEVAIGIEIAQEVEPGIQLSEAAGRMTSSGIVLGPQGIDDLGRTGRLHTVSSGDTLWDLSAAYLGTPWVWPSVWIDNDEIDNPHLIMPGDRIWITANEMRIVSAAEAESFLNPAVEQPMVVEDSGLEAMEVTEPIQPLAALEVEPDDPSTLEAFPVAVPGQESESMNSGKQVTVSLRDAMGFVSADDLAGSSSIVGSSVERRGLAAGDPVVLGMGEGDVEIGDQFTIFEVVEGVRDIETNRILGHHVEVLGWVEVKELTGDTSIAEIRMSYEEVRRGFRVMPREILSRHVTVRSTPDVIEGKVVFLPSDATVTGDGGYVYLNRGEFHGVEIGSELEVFDRGKIVNERLRRVDVRTPDHSVARLVVVTVKPDSSVAFVVSSTRELGVGDDVRSRDSRLAQR